MKKQKEDLPYKFWGEYESLNMLKRGKKIKPIIDMIDRLHNLKDKKIRQHALATALQGYFDDLIDCMTCFKRKKRG